MLSNAKMKLTTALLTALSLILCIPVIYTSAAEPTGVIQQFNVDGTGKAEVIGYFDNTTQTETSLLLTDTDDMSIVWSAPNEHIMYIDQIPLGNNGAFYCKFQIDEKFSESPYVLKMNGGVLIEQRGTLKKIPATVYNIADNAVRVGNDAYDIGCKSYTSNNISRSIEQGGNKIYYKIGGKWFDMLNPNATSTAYFTEANAVPKAEWDAWEINTYYHY